MILIFDGSNLCTDIWKTIFVILEVQFHHEGGLSETCYLELFFSAWSIFSPCQKSASTGAPFNLFWTLTVILTIFAFWKIYKRSLVQNLGHYHLKKCKISCLGGLLKEKQESTSDLFFNIQKPYRPSCPIVRWAKQITWFIETCSYGHFLRWDERKLRRGLYKYKATSADN